MGYYHIKLSDTAKELCTITTQWGKYEYQWLPLGLFNSPNIFQEKMNDLLDGIDSKMSSPVCDKQDLKSTLRNPISNF